MSAVAELSENDQTVARYVDFVYAAARRQCTNDAMAEDVTQAVFVVAARKKKSGGLPEEKYMMGWLLQTTRYTVKAARRAAMRRAFHERRAGQSGSSELHSDDAAAEELRGALDEALLQLNAVDREVIVRRYLHGEGLKEVGDAVGMSENSAGKRLLRAMEKLRQLLRRRGVVTPLAMLVGLMSVEGGIKAPPAMVASVGHVGKSAGANELAREVLRRCVMAKVAWSSAAVLAVVVGGAGLVMIGQLRGIVPPARADGGTVAAPDPTAPAAGSLEEAWANLAEHEPQASRGLLTLAEKRGEAVGFLKDRLRPLKIDAATVRALITDLGSDEDVKWRAAYEKLSYFDPRLAIDLPTLMDEVTTGPTRNRLVAVLSDLPPDSWKQGDEPYEGRPVELRKNNGTANDYNFTVNHGSFWAESEVARLTAARGNAKRKWSQADCGILVLEQIGTPDAVAILKEMATGHADAEPTVLAKNALDEMAASATQPAKVDLDRRWADLQKESPVANPALLKFSGMPTEAVAYFKEQLHPLLLTHEEMQTLAQALGSDDEKVWKPAFEKMEYYDPRLAGTVEEAFYAADEGIGQTRMAEVMSDRGAGSLKSQTVKLRRTEKDFFNFSDDRGSWGAYPTVEHLGEGSWSSKRTWLRAARAEVLLGRIGSAEATEVLTRMATGHADALPTKVAVEELKRAGEGNK